MKNQCCTEIRKVSAGTIRIVLAMLLSLLLVSEALCQPQGRPERKKVPAPKSALKLADVPFKIVYESYRATDGKENWELYLINADGSNPVNLTRSPDVDEMYPHASPDGGKISFVADEIVNGEKIRNVYYMNIDGTGRTKMADNARQECWSPDGKTIAYLKGEFERYTTKDFATKGIFAHGSSILATDKAFPIIEHPKLRNLLVK